MTGGMCNPDEYLLTKKRLRNTLHILRISQFSTKTSASSLKFFSILVFPLKISRKRPFVTTFCRQTNAPIFKKNMGSSPSPSTTTNPGVLSLRSSQRNLGCHLNALAQATKRRVPRQDLQIWCFESGDSGQKKGGDSRPYIYIYMSHISICGGSSVEVKKIKHDISPSQGDILKKVLD